MRPTLDLFKVARFYGFMDAQVDSFTLSTFDAYKVALGLPTARPFGLETIKNLKVGQVKLFGWGNEGGTDLRQL